MKEQRQQEKGDRAKKGQGSNLLAYLQFRVGNNLEIPVGWLDILESSWAWTMFFSGLPHQRGALQ